MKRMLRAFGTVLLCVGLIAFSGCAESSVKPLSYAASVCPTGPIKAGGRPVETSHSRGGPYLVNLGFRPAPDIASYLKRAESEAGTDVLKNAEVELHVPFALDIFLFGVQFGSDTVTANN